MQMKDLERYGFITVSHVGAINVHDVYMTFAKSPQGGPSKHLSSSVSWWWKYIRVGDGEAGSKLSLENQNLTGEGVLRALILEVGEGYERVDLQGFSALKALGLINCKSMVVLGLQGLSSLEILEIRNCTSFRQSVCNNTSLQNVKQLCIIKKRTFSSAFEEDFEVPEVAHFRQERKVSRLLSVASNVLKRLMAPFKQPTSLELGALASRMRSLQVLRIQNTGTSWLELVGSNWSQLRELVVIEQHLQRFEMGHLPNLTQAMLCYSDKYESDSILFENHNHNGEEFLDPCDYRVDVISRHELPGKGLLVGCPQLKRVTMQSPFFKQEELAGAGLVSFHLQCSHNIRELPDFSLSADTLEKLGIQWCEKLERVNFDIGFKSFSLYYLDGCNNVMEVSGLGYLPSLRGLYVCYCKKLQKLIGFDKCKKLKELHLDQCPELTEVSCFSSHDMEKLDECGGCRLSLKNLTSLVLQVEYCSSLEVVILEDLNNLENLSLLVLKGEEKRVHPHERRRRGFSSLDLDVLLFFQH